MEEFTPLKNDLLLRALNGEKVERPPVWMMRQAGRYLPDYITLRKKYSFFERVENPELATEITLMPVDQVGTDAAILFSDILVIPQALGLEVRLEEGLGPRLPDPINTVDRAMEVVQPDVEDRLHYIMDAVRMIRRELNGRVPLIGFAGAPWTLLCYMIEGQGSKDFSKAKAFCYQNPQTAEYLLDTITETTISYLKAQVEAGAQAVQVFDSWSGLLSPEDFSQFCMPFLKRIADTLAPEVPVILFAKGSWYALERLAWRTDASAVGIDWATSPEYARQATGGNVTLQGNFDPSRLLGPVSEIRKQTRTMIDRFGKDRYIANLGHGILPNTPVDHAKAFVDTVKEYTG